MHLDNRRLGASHTLDFHIAVLRYEKVGHANLPAALLAISQSIVGEFVMRRSPHAVPLSDEAREVILSAHARGPVPAKLLHTEAERIFTSLTTNDLPGFTDTPAFAELLQTLGAYSAELVAAEPIATLEDLQKFKHLATEARAAVDAERELPPISLGLPPGASPPPPLPHTLPPLPEEPLDA